MEFQVPVDIRRGPGGFGLNGRGPGGRSFDRFVRGRLGFGGFYSGKGSLSSGRSSGGFGLFFRR